MTPVTPTPTAFLTDPTAIREWLDRYCDCSGEVTISHDGRVSVTGYVIFNTLAENEIQQFAVQFVQVGRTFDCSNCQELQTLAGSPPIVGGTFRCCNCVNLVSLVGAPVQVNGGFECSDCPKIITLEGSPTLVGGHFECDSCYALQNLTGAPQTVGSFFNCSQCPDLISLVGAPNRVEDYFNCHNCYSLQSLEGMPQVVGGNFSCANCENLSGIEGLGIVNGRIALTHVKKPKPESVVNLLRQRAVLDTSQKSEWISVVNDYHKSGDLLTAIARFEAYYQVPFETTAPEPQDQQVLTL